MNNIKKLSNFCIIAKGYLWVNLPITVIILVIWYVSTMFFSVSNFIGVFVGSSVGWIYWEYAIKKWIKWALYNNVNQDKLLKIGQLSLLLWNRTTIDKVVNSKK